MMRSMWKTWGGQCVYHINDIRIFQNAFYRWLKFDSDALQTVLNRKHPEIPGLQYLEHLSLVARLCPGDSCILGLGGAGAAHFLSPYLKRYQLVAVERDKEVIQIAKDYFMADTLTNLTIIHEDANLFVHQHRGLFHHILVDLFDAHHFPKECHNTDFFNHCRKRLKSGGVLAVNLADTAENWSILKHIRDSFASLTMILPVKGTPNMVVLGYNDYSLTPLLNQLQGSREIKRVTWDAKWGCIIERGKRPL